MSSCWEVFRQKPNNLTEKYMIKQLNLISRSSLMAVTVGALCLSTSAFAANKTEGMAMGMVDQKDKDFMMEAAKSGMMEVDMGKMAEQKGQSGDVKMLGQKMVADHTKANNELMGLAKQKGVMLDTKHKMMKLGASNFDQAWLAQMVTDHQKTIALFEGEAKGGKDGATKKFASKNLPTLKSHLKMVQAAQGKMMKKA